MGNLWCEMRGPRVCCMSLCVLPHLCKVSVCYDCTNACLCVRVQVVQKGNFHSLIDMS